ncbi:hypothetical protein NDU88_007202, partial [Pleurodeles waltl]
MNTSRSGTDREETLKPSARRSMPCLAQSQTHPQHLSKHSSLHQPNQIQPQPLVAEPASESTTQD